MSLMGPVGPALAGHEVEFERYLLTRTRWEQWLDWFACEVLGCHQWRRLEDHPMHHRCPLCKRECMDWVW